MSAPVVIVGGGLAGLCAARRLHRAGAPFELLEARDRFGGRVLSVDERGAASDGFDLGASWIWPDMQPMVADLVAALGLPVFAQHADGDVLFERTAQEAPARYPAMAQGPMSMRLAGGTGALADALVRGLPATSLRLDTRVAALALESDGIDVRFVADGGAERSIRASHVVLALPPRLIEARLAFSPAIDATTARRWRATPTWMAPHAKVFALYARPFWRDAGLSGMAQSLVGPLVEIHDATTASGQAALFGFVGLRAAQRAALGQDALIAASLQQLARLFGPRAAEPTRTLFKDWAADPLTATAADQTPGEHPEPDPRPWITGAWHRHLSLIGSETGATHPGYLAGAIEAAARVAVVQGEDAP